MTIAVIALLVVGVNLVAWGAIGLLRLIDDRRRRTRAADVGRPPAVEDLAVLIPAHNEERVIGGSIAAVAASIPTANVFVVADASGDRTADVARSAGASVLELHDNVGKAGALAAGLHHFELTRHFDGVLLLDADTRVRPDYLERATELLADPDVAVVAGYAQAMWDDLPRLSPIGRALLAHRNRVWTLTQLLLRFGQTWRFTNVTHIVPGFASLYRSSVLDRLDIDPGGLVIEDFNMTFEVQRRRLGRIAMTPAVAAYTQDPYRLRDYVRQVRRWTLGFWQTIRRHGLWRGGFWPALALYVTEIVTSSVLMLALPLIATILFVPALAPDVLQWGPWAAAHGWLTEDIAGWTILAVVVAADYALTLAVAIGQRRPRMAVWGLASLPLRVVDAAIALVTIPRALADSTGTWTSPARR